MNDFFGRRRQRLLRLKLLREGAAPPPLLAGAPPLVCDTCGKEATRAAFAKNLSVCPHCGAHRPIGAYQRLAQLLDHGSFRELDEALTAGDPLQFAGYTEKKQACRAGTALHEAVVTAKGKVEGLPAVFAVLDSRFLMGSMVATTQYADSIRTAIAAGVDAIVCGAGLPTDLPATAAGANVALAPIVSSARAAAMICRLWQRRYDTLPDFVVVEGCLAGGHLGFGKEELLAGTAPSLETLVAQVTAALQPFEEQANRRIPVFAAGGVWGGQDAARLAAAGAAGVQVATRLIATTECDASQTYKDTLIAAQKQDIMEIIQALGTPTINEFASFVQISSPNAAYKVNSLIQKGYLRKVRSQSDRREYHLEVTQKYIDYYNVSYRYLSTVMGRIKQRFSAQEVAQLEEMLHVISTELMPEIDLPDRGEDTPFLP